MPTIRLPEESEHGDMVKKVDAMIREISKSPSMSAATRALGLRPSILIGEHQELAHIMAKRGLLNLQNHMIGLAVAAARSAPYELYGHTRVLQLEYGLDSGQIVELAATVAHVTSINAFEKVVAAFNDNAPMRAQDPSAPVLVEVRPPKASDLVVDGFDVWQVDADRALVLADGMDEVVHPGQAVEEIENDEAQPPGPQLQAGGRLGEELAALGDDDRVDDEHRRRPGAGDHRAGPQT